MTDSDGFHPDLTSGESARRSLRSRVHHVRASELSAGTAQTEGMQRFAAISGTSVGSENIWMGETHVSPATASVKSASPPRPAITSSSLHTFRTEKKTRIPTLPL